MKDSLPPGAPSISSGSGNGTVGKGLPDSAQGLEAKRILQNVLFFEIGSSVAKQMTEMVREFCEIRFGGDVGSRSEFAYVEKRGGLSVTLIDSTSVRLRVMAAMGSCSSETVPRIGIGKTSKTTPWVLSAWMTRMVDSEGKSRIALMAVF